MRTNHSNMSKLARPCVVTSLALLALLCGCHAAPAPGKYLFVWAADSASMH